MELEEFRKKHKINKIYKYSQIQIGNTIEFGWVESKDLSLDEPVVVSYHSRSKAATLGQIKWSKDEKSSATPVKDYRKYFEALTGSTPSDFLKRWGKSEKEFGLFWKDNNPNGWEGPFVVSLAKLLAKKKSFIMYGRGFKIV